MARPGPPWIYTTPKDDMRVLVNGNECPLNAPQKRELQKLHDAPSTLELGYLNLFNDAAFFMSQDGNAMMLVIKRVMAPLEEEAWRVEGVTFNGVEFDHLKRTCTTLARTRPLDLRAVSEVLLEAKRLLTPHQARELYAILRPGVLNPSELPETSDARTWVSRGQPSLIVLLAGFMVDATRWINMPLDDKVHFWDDENSGCNWANSTPPRAAANSYETKLRANLRAGDAAAVDPAQCDWCNIYESCWLDFFNERPHFPQRG